MRSGLMLAGAALVALAGGAAPAATGGPEPTDPAASGNEIVVTADSEGYARASKGIANAVKAYRKYRARYAPGARLQLEFEGIDRATSADAFRLIDGDRTFPLHLDASGKADLTALPEGDWALTAAGSPGKFKLQTWTFSPGSTVNDWRLGDVHLHCRVAWAMMRASVSPVMAGMFDIAGGCRSGSIGLYENLGHPVAEARVVESGKVEPIKLLPPDRIRLPTWMKGFSNDARVEVDFSD